MTTWTAAHDAFADRVYRLRDRTRRSSVVASTLAVPVVVAAAVRGGAYAWFAWLMLGSLATDLTDALCARVGAAWAARQLARLDARAGSAPRAEWTPAQLPDPDAIGGSEYRLVHRLLLDAWESAAADGADAPAAAASSLDELIGWALAIRHGMDG
ncbi:MAG TPA: hypothetical protein VHD87_15555 [Acidimicrobiales bacterium]|nr:hypothetical protein [Acidimicrobiales bacterium]